MAGCWSQKTSGIAVIDPSASGGLTTLEHSDTWKAFLSGEGRSSSSAWQIALCEQGQEVIVKQVIPEAPAPMTATESTRDLLILVYGAMLIE